LYFSYYVENFIVLVATQSLVFYEGNFLATYIQQTRYHLNCNTIWNEFTSPNLQLVYVD